MWQALREELAPKGFELITVGMDTLGAAGCRPYIEAAAPTHPSLIDEHHVLAKQFGVINIPSAFWINEAGILVRPPEPAPAPPKAPTGEPATAPELPPAMPERMMEMMGEAMKIQAQPEAYHAALKDWVQNGDESAYALAPEAVIARSRPRDADNALGHAHFELGSRLHQLGEEQAAITHFREAHRLVPDSWTFRRQAWSLKPVGDGPFARFWQGPVPGQESDWPYEGDWLTDVRKVGAEHYNDRWQP